MRIRTLKVRSILLVMPVITVLATAMGYAVLKYFEQRFKDSIEGQQFVLVTRVAAEQDSKIASAQRALTLVARLVPPVVVGSPREAERFLDSRPDLKSIFGNNLVLFSPAGVLIAETGQRPSRTGTDFSYREYIKITRQDWKPHISSPYTSTLKHVHPVVMFTAPVFDVRGNPAAILGGSIDLMSLNFLGSLADAKIGKTGYFYLFTTDRTMVMHPDRSRIMKMDIPYGANRLLDRAVAGFEGSGETVTSTGLHTIAAFRRLSSVNWILAANYPMEEAYAPIRDAKNSGWWIIVFGVLTNAGLIMLAIRRLTFPLVSLTTQIREIGGGGAGDAQVSVDTGDEIGDLAVAFNSLMGQLRSKERELVKSHELFQFLSDFSTDWIFWRTPDGKMLYVSPAASHISGYSVAELLAGDPDYMDLIHPDDRAVWEGHVVSANLGEEEKPIEYRIITKQGETRWITHICRPIYDSSGAIMGVRGSNSDITERKRAETALRESEEKFRLITLSAHDAIVMIDNQGLVTFWNPAAEKMFGYLKEEMLGQNIHRLIVPSGYDSSLEGAISKWQRTGEGDLFGKSVELAALRKDGAKFIVELSLSCVEISEQVYAIGVLRDITERKQTEEQLRYMSTHDVLTGLYNRAYFEEEMERLCRSRRFPVSVVMADVDDLKVVNDSLGHEAGDAMIRRAAEILTRAFRGDDVIARIGGDEFAVLLSGSDEAAVQGAVGRIRSVLEQVNSRDAGYSLSISIGATTTYSVEDLRESLKKADQLMYLDKASRKGS